MTKCGDFPEERDKNKGRTGILTTSLRASKEHFHKSFETISSLHLVKEPVESVWRGGY